MNSDAKAAAPQTATLVAPGDVIDGKYRIEAVVGRGGMSVVYRATHLQLDQLVAIKVLSAAALVMPEYVSRLGREARAASGIRSEHVVRIFDIGELPAKAGRPGGDLPYLVMEYLVGADLAAVLNQRGPLPIHLAVECMMQVCEALAEAHALGIIHRDLKPANLFLTEAVDGSPCVKVLDFGISRMMRRGLGFATLTDPGTVLGTPNYMAPEQMEAAEGVDARSDIWAMGAILYELLVGRPPFSGQSLPQLFVKILRSKTPRPSAARNDVDPGLDQLVARCLAIDPLRRYATIAELAWALAALDIPGTTGTHRREAAARIARVFERRSSTSGIDQVLSAPPVVVREPTEEEDLASSFRRRLAAAASAALLLGGAVGFVVVARDAAVSDVSSRRAALSSSPMIPSSPVLKKPILPPAEPAVVVLPVLEPKADAGHAASPPVPEPRKPRIGGAPDAGELAVAPTSARLDETTTEDLRDPKTE